MRKVAYSLETEKISKNMKVIWFGTERLTKKDPWRKLAQHAIRVGKSTDVEEMLDKKGFEVLVPSYSKRISSLNGTVPPFY